MSGLGRDARQVLSDLGWCDSDCDDLDAALERARVVGVLDAWAAKGLGRNVAPFEWRSGHWVCRFRSSDNGDSGCDDIRDIGEGSTPDAARAAAAKAIEAGEV